MGPSGESFCDELDAAGVEYERHEREFVSGEILNAAFGDWLHVVDNGAMWLALASAFKAWLKHRSTRDVMIQTAEHRSVHAKGLPTEDVVRLLEAAESVRVLDVEKPDPTKPKRIEKKGK